ncbi:MAG: MerR family transcriptional regulator [Arcanobacterium sp.]|nr:MerR family transcriptional regulator [Arcanobacterium sp.]
MNPLARLTRSPQRATIWPHDVSQEPTLKIGEVVRLLKEEFPYLATSKIRYYESQKLISSHRTDSNQRLFSRAMVERLRFALIEQRDRYTRLPQIREMLAQMDRGEVIEAHPSQMRAVSPEAKYVAKPGTRLYREELAALIGVPLSKIDEYINAGLLNTDARGRLTSQSVDIVRTAQQLETYGIPLRQLQVVKNSANAHAANLINLLADDLSAKHPVAKERALADAAELSVSLTNLYRALLVERIDVELR